MRPHLSPLIFLGLMLQGFPAAWAGAAKDPQAILVAAAPLYDFSDPAMKPWHLKATYQLYDYKGKPTEQGTFEYWWASPKVHRASWTRQGSTWTDWHTPDGKHLFLASGDKPKYFESFVESALFSPLPNQASMNPYKIHLDFIEKLINGFRYSCVALNPIQGQDRINESLNFASLYCFDPARSILLFRDTLGTLTTEFDDVGKFQGKYLARQVLVFAGGAKVLSISVDSVTGIDASDLALIPAPDAAPFRPEDGRVSQQTARNYLIKGSAPTYPALAQELKQEGTVIMACVVGIDGKVRELEVVAAPSEILAEQARNAVSKWEFKPYLIDGKPSEMRTNLEINFSLRR